ncbi:MAG: 3-dehydro-L-gulonate 2-dehydrogenase [Spirochaetaceae bacterium]|jgi:3-dehydro-L-gulonate 2-dehydrogenase|nr:3-dehydro-L-gulonate 2-dehydrogenase [Spirochaetaceae bacterium]
MRVSYDELYEVMNDRLIKYGVPEEIAAMCARNLAETSLSGVYSHGLNRFSRIISMVKKGLIKPHNRPEQVSALGALEVWDGRLGMGNTNAVFCMDRAIDLAKKNGAGVVALRNTNHWMRGGAFGIQAALAGCAAICWTTTMPNMPVWGGADCRIGNNPLVFCVPYGDSYVLFDGAMAQFSYGAIESAQLAGKQLPVAGGYDENGNLTTDPDAIAKTWRVLPIGFWKGSGFSVLMDMMASVLSGGKTIGEIGKQGTTPEDEYGLNQMFIAMNVDASLGGAEKIDAIIADIKASVPAEGASPIRYPSEREKRVREENLHQGIPVNEAIWNAVKAL